MIFRETVIEGLHEVVLERHADERGSFARTFCGSEFSKSGLPMTFVQASASVSRHAGTVRGMHFQKGDHGEGKLVRCVRGAVHDVVTDLRPASSTFLQSLSFQLRADGNLSLYVPPGCGHGFQTLEDDTEVLYQMTTEYAAAHASGFRYDDPSVKIVWPRTITTISRKDLEWPQLSVAGSSN